MPRDHVAFTTQLSLSYIGVIASNQPATNYNFFNASIRNSYEWSDGEATNYTTRCRVQPTTRDSDAIVYFLFEAYEITDAAWINRMWCLCVSARVRTARRR